MTRRTVLIGSATRAIPVDRDWWMQQEERLTADGWWLIEEWDTAPATEPDRYFRDRQHQNVTRLLAGTDQEDNQ